MTTYDFETVHRMAWHLGQKLTELESHFARTGDHWKWVGHKNRCFSIARAMDIIAETPSAKLGKKVLAAFDKRLEETHEMLADWCEGLLNPNALKESDLPY